MSPQLPYQTQLTPAEEKEYQGWAKLNGVSDVDSDYDHRGFWKAGKQGLGPDGMPTTQPLTVPHGDGTMHGPDTWKVPGRKRRDTTDIDSFSNESKYSISGQDPYWTPQGRLTTPGYQQNAMADPFNETSGGRAPVATIKDESQAQQSLAQQGMINRLSDPKAGRYRKPPQ